MAAGGSASRRAQEARRQERLLREQWQAARETARRWEAASEGEQRVAAQLLVLAERGWRLLVDRRWPGTRAANVDMLLVGPGGVFVLDVKNWRAAPEVAAGHLTAGGRSCDTHVRKLLAVTLAAERALASLGLSPVAVQPVMVFAGHRLDTSLGRVRLLGEREAGPALLSERHRLGTGQIRALTDHLEREFPEYEAPAAHAPAVARRTPASQGTNDGSPPDGLFDLDGLRDAVLEEARRAPIEQWMTFLHPEQVALVRRDWSGPARISGPAGTGKTVVGLHRAVRLAQRTTGRILYVTFANNLPRVQASLLAAMAPAVAHRVEFRSLHGWASEFLRNRGVPVRLSESKAATAFSTAWLEAGRGSCLEEIDPLPQYWREEIDHVIKGRGIASFDEYATVPRRRRRTVLRRTHRQAVWELYQAYEALLAARGVHDFNDILSHALRAATRPPPDCPPTPYTAVIADEVQDLTLVGVRLLHTLAGDRPNGLLLVGDGQQAVYPGGFRLSEAGLDIRGGRSHILRVNYRNSRPILDAALAVVADDPFEDLDGEPTPGHRDVDLAYQHGQVRRLVASTLAEHDRALLEALRALPPGARADAAILCPYRRSLDHYLRLLRQAGLPVCSLEQYDGSPVDAIKLGSYHRAKGLEFKQVFLPQHDTPPPDDSAAAPTRERAQLARSRLFVAMTRARDLLWLGSVRPSAS